MSEGVQNLVFAALVSIATGVGANFVTPWLRGAGFRTYQSLHAFRIARVRRALDVTLVIANRSEVGLAMIGRAIFGALVFIVILVVASFALIFTHLTSPSALWKLVVLNACSGALGAGVSYMQFAYSESALAFRAIWNAPSEQKKLEAMLARLNGSAKLPRIE